MNVVGAMLLVGRHALVRSLRSRRTFFLGFLCVLPWIITAVALGESSKLEFEFWAGLVLFAYFHIVAGFGALFLGPGVLGDEIEGRTITYPFTRPIPRGAFYVARLFGYVLAYSVLVAVSLFVSASMLAERMTISPTLLLGTIGVTCGGFAVYAAILAALRVVTDKAIYIGFLFGAALEVGLSKAPASGLSKWSVWHHMAVVEWRLAERDAFGVPTEFLNGMRPEETLPGAVLVLAGTFVAAVAIGVYLVRSREIRVPAAVG